MTILLHRQEYMDKPCHANLSTKTYSCATGIVICLFVWIPDIEGGKGTGGESIYGPLFEGRVEYSSLLHGQQ